MAKATKPERKSMRELARRLPKDLCEGVLYDGQHFCTLGFMLHEVGVPEQCLLNETDLMPTECLPDAILELMPPDGDWVEAQDLANAIWPEVPAGEFLDMMSDNDNTFAEYRHGKMQARLESLAETLCERVTSAAPAVRSPFVTPSCLGRQ